MRERKAWPAVLVAVAGVAVTVFVGYLLATWPPEPPESDPATAATPDRRTTGPSDPAQNDDERNPVLVVLGDEFTASSDASSGPEWPRLLARDLGWDLVVDAQDDTGYLHDAGGDAFAARLPGALEREADVVVLAGGENDLARHATADIAAAAVEVVSRVTEAAPDAEVVLSSPFSKGRPGPLTRELTAALENVADEQGIGFVDATGWLTPSDEVYGADPDHPDDQGQRRIAENVRAELERLGLT